MDHLKEIAEAYSAYAEIKNDMRASRKAGDDAFAKLKSLMTAHGLTILDAQRIAWEQVAAAHVERRSTIAGGILA